MDGRTARLGPWEDPYACDAELSVVFALAVIVHYSRRLSDTNPKRKSVSEGRIFSVIAYGFEVAAPSSLSRWTTDFALQAAQILFRNLRRACLGGGTIGAGTCREPSRRSRRDKLGGGENR